MADNPTQIYASSTPESTALTNMIVNKIETGTYGRSSAPSPSTENAASNTIRNISQTTQEREIIKTAPDIVVFLDGLPYLINYFVNDPRTGAVYTLVNFNDKVTTFSASYDTESLIPNCSIQLQIPNHEKYLYQMPGGNNLLQTMAQVQVYAKSYFMAATGDTVYRRVFKGVTSYIGYNDNGKTLEVSIQCHGILHLLEKMQINIHPSSITSNLTGARQTIMQSILSSGDCFQIIAMLFTEAFQSDGFQIGSMYQPSLIPGTAGLDMYYDAISRGYMAKWQAILYNMVKDVHIYGPNKDNLGNVVVMKRDGTWGKPDKRLLAASTKKRSTKTETQTVADNDAYYANIQQYKPYAVITTLDFSNNVIVNRLDAIREVVRKIDFEAYQDIDGKIIIKPPLYNLDVVNVGQRLKQTSSQLNSSHNSHTNPVTAIYENNNPFVIHLSEILTEQENEDQSAIRRTRTTVCGSVCRSLAIKFPNEAKTVGEYIDVTKLAKFGLREEPLYEVPWLDMGNKFQLFAHAVSETVRANRAYRTYTITIPMRPELKLGFPVYIPHKDMYAYIKSIQVQYSVGGTATMTLTCDSVRRRVMINTQQTQGTGNSATPLSYYTPAPNLVVQWTKNAPNPTSPDPSQSPSNARFQQNVAQVYAQGQNGGVSRSSTNMTNLAGTSLTLQHPSKNPDGSSFAGDPAATKVYTAQSQNAGSTAGNQTDSPYATYVVKNDNNKAQGTVDPATGHGYFDKKRAVDNSYLQALMGTRGTTATPAVPAKPGTPSVPAKPGIPATISQNGTITPPILGVPAIPGTPGTPAVPARSGTSGSSSTIPYTDEKGYEVLAPFPWGRYMDLNTVIRQVTEQGWITPPTDAQGNFTQDLEEEATLNNAQAFLFAGMGTPTTTSDPSTQLISALNQNIALIGGSLTGNANNLTQASQSGATNPATGQSTNNTSTGIAGQGIVPQQPDATVIILHYDATQPGSNATNSLLNASQPENAFAEQMLKNTQSSQQQLVDVLLSGKIAPVPAVQEALLATQTQTASAQNLALLRQITPGG